MSDISKIKMSSNRSFGLVFFVIFFIIALWNFRGDFFQIKLIPLFFSFIFLFLGLINSKFLTPLNKLWFKFGIFLGGIISPIVMAIIFFLVVTPIGLFMKMIGKDILKKKYDKKNKSYWIKKDDRSSKMNQQF